MEERGDKYRRSHDAFLSPGGSLFDGFAEEGAAITDGRGDCVARTKCGLMCAI